MPTSALIPDDRRRMADLERRVGILERALSATGAPAVDELVFSYAGALASGTESAPKMLRQSGVLTVLAVAFKPGSAGSTDTVLEILRNGVVVNTVTVPATWPLAALPVGVAFSGGDIVALNVLTAGTGAADMTATAWFT